MLEEAQASVTSTLFEPSSDVGYGLTAPRGTCCVAAQLQRKAFVFATNTRMAVTLRTRYKIIRFPWGKQWFLLCTRSLPRALGLTDLNGRTQQPPACHAHARWGAQSFILGA